MQRAFEWYATGRFSDRDIAQRLNAYQVSWPDGTTIPLRSKGRNYASRAGEKEQSHYRAPGAFSKDAVRDMLTRPFYTGKNAYYGSHFDGQRVVKHPHPQHVFDGRHVPIISEGLFFRCHQVRLSRGRAPRGGKGTKRRPARVYPLSGLLYCARDGAPMHSQAAGRNNTRRHICSHRIQTGTCDQVSVRAEVLEAHIGEVVSQLILPEEWMDRVLAFALDEGGLAVLQRQREVLEDNFQSVRQAYEEGKLGNTAYRRAWRAYQRRLQELQPESSPKIDHDKIRALLLAFGQIWSLASPLEQRGLLQTMLRRGQVDNQRLFAVEWHPPFDQLLGGIE